MAAPFGLLVLNLGAAIITTPRFRADLPLLVFHLALLALVALFIAGRLIYLDGHAILTRGAEFEGQLERHDAGPLHRLRVETLRFTNVGFVERDPEGSYRNTRNVVRWRNPASGRGIESEIGSDRPLILDGYRIYPTRYRGLSPILVWQPDSGGPAETGTVQMPPLSAAQDAFPRGVAWYLSDGTELWSQVVSAVPARELDHRANLGVETLDHVLIVWQGERRFELRPGDSAALSGGQLRYQRLESWISYRIVYDPTEPWLAAAIIVAVGSLAVFYGRRFRRPIPDRDGDGLVPTGPGAG